MRYWNELSIQQHRKVSRISTFKGNRRKEIKSKNKGTCNKQVGKFFKNFGGLLFEKIIYRY